MHLGEYEWGFYNVYVTTDVRTIMDLQYTRSVHLLNFILLFRQNMIKNKKKKTRILQIKKDLNSFICKHD